MFTSIFSTESASSSSFTRFEAAATTTTTTTTCNMTTSSIVRSEKCWDVTFGPIKKHMVAGKLVPTIRGVQKLIAVQKHRRIVIQIVSSSASTTTTTTTTTSDIEDKRGNYLDWLILQSDEDATRDDGGTFQSSSKSSSIQSSWQDGDSVVIRVLGPKNVWGFRSSHTQQQHQRTRLFSKKKSDKKTFHRKVPRSQVFGSQPSNFGARDKRPKDEDHFEYPNKGEDDDDSSFSSRSSNSSIDDEHHEENDKTPNITDGDSRESHHYATVQYYQINLDEISNMKIIRTTSAKVNGNESCVLEVTVGRGKGTVVRDIIFQTSQDLQKYVKCIQNLKLLKIESSITKASTSVTFLSNELEAAKASVRNHLDNESVMANASSSPMKGTFQKLISRFTSSWLYQQQQAQQQQIFDDEEKQSMTRGGSDDSFISSKAIQNDDRNTRINILVEIVSATDIPDARKGDKRTSDPYVIVWLGTQEIHRTSVIKNSLFPIWTVETGSLFVLQMTLSEFFKASSVGLTFDVMNSKSTKRDELLGRISIPQHKVLEFASPSTKSAKNTLKNRSSGRTQQQRQQRYVPRRELPMTNLLARFDVEQAVVVPKLNLRFKNATREDLRFLKVLYKVSRKKKQQGTDALGVFSDYVYVEPKWRTKVNPLTSRRAKKIDGIVCHLVKPGPDPDRPEDQTLWMTSSQIQDECFMPSTKWIEAGTGQIGYLYLEILKCDNLPNLDDEVLSRKSNVTDAFCGIVYEDSSVNTHVINDELSPRFMPWTQRAFVFRMGHLSSELHIGVFDHDKVDFADIVGRVSINLANLCPDTEYILTYPLYDTVFSPMDYDSDDKSCDDASTKRIPRGTITVRLKINLPNYRYAILKSMIPKTNAVCISVPTRDGFHQRRFITLGDENNCVLNLKAVTSYTKELLENLDCFYYIHQAAMTVLLWRGHYTVFGGDSEGTANQKSTSCFKCSIKLPLHSLVAFLWGIFLAEDPSLIPSFVLFCVAWLFLATNELSRKDPHPSQQCHSFGKIWQCLIVGHGPAERDTFKA